MTVSVSVLRAVVSIWADISSSTYGTEGPCGDPWTAVWRAPLAEWLLIHCGFPAFSFPTLLGPVWVRFLNDVCPILLFSRDCQQAHLHKASTNIRVFGPDFGFVEDMVFIFWFILTGVQVSQLHFSPNFHNSEILLLLSSQIRGRGQSLPHVPAA